MPGNTSTDQNNSQSEDVWRQQVLAQPDMLTEDAFRLRCKEAFAKQLPETLRVLVVPDAAGKLYFPAWQINLSGLGAVLAMLEGIDHWAQFRFLTSPDAMLRGQTPLALLQAGDKESVIGAARIFADRVRAGG